EGSLSTLSLAQFISRSSNSIVDRKELVSHLSQVASTVSLLTSKVKKVLDDYESNSNNQLVSHLAELDPVDLSSSIFWQVSRNLRRTRMHSWKGADLVS